MLIEEANHPQQHHLEKLVAPNTLRSPDTGTILVTGGAGYLGSVLVPLLLEQGHAVRVFDCFYFGEDALRRVREHPRLTIIRDDILNHDNHADLFRGVESVVHLASISNDPSCDLDPNLSIRTNYSATISLARRAKIEGVRRFLFMSSCSVYGARGDQLLDESSETSPVTLYALTKLECEPCLIQLSSRDFCVTILRLATLFGLSPRMRFDLAVNVMVKRAMQGLGLVVSGTGTQYRPFVHVRDAARAVAGVLEAEHEKVAGEIFNVGSDELNYTISDMALEIGALFPGVPITRAPNDKDSRSYRVSFRKIREKLDVIPKRTVRDAVVEISAALRTGTIQDPDREIFYNLLLLKKTNSITKPFYSPASAPRWANVLVRPPAAIDAPATVLQARVPMLRQKPKIVAMVLAYNCEKLLPRAVERIPRHLVDDVIVMDDGSRDNTSAVARRLGLKVFRHEPNRGYGGNVKAGLTKALDLGADYVVEVHGDGAQFDPGSIAFALPHIDEGADLILGSRFQDPQQALKDGMPWIRFVANRILSFFDRIVLELPLTEFHTGFRIYSRRMLQRIPFQANSDDYLFSFQIIAQAAYYGMRVVEVPTSADYRSDHTSHRLSGAALYALQTFFVLGSYWLARRSWRHTALFPQLDSHATEEPRAVLQKLAG